MFWASGCDPSSKLRQALLRRVRWSLSLAISPAVSRLVRAMTRKSSASDRRNLRPRGEQVDHPRPSAPTEYPIDLEVRDPQGWRPAVGRRQDVSQRVAKGALAMPSTVAEEEGRARVPLREASEPRLEISWWCCGDGPELPPPETDSGEQLHQVVGAEISITQDAGEGAATEFPVQRDDERVFAPGLLQADVATALADDFPALLAQRLDQALAGDHRLARAHAGRGIERRITPLSSGSPSSRRPST